MDFLQQILNVLGLSVNSALATITVKRFTGEIN